jgi:hypothetical protein
MFVKLANAKEFETINSGLAGVLLTFYSFEKIYIYFIDPFLRSKSMSLRILITVPAHSLMLFSQ